jgi:hypothetical protein
MFENARLKLNRLQFVGHSAAQAAQRMSSAQSAWSARAAAQASAAASMNITGRWSDAPSLVIARAAVSGGVDVVERVSSFAVQAER